MGSAIQLLPLLAVVGQELPRWDARVPTPGSSSPTAGLPTPAGVTHSTVFRAFDGNGYNHGPMMDYANGTFVMSWYNGVLNESVYNRVLFATSPDAQTWSDPAVLFKTTAGTHHNSSTPAASGDGDDELGFTKGYDIGLENEAWVFSRDGVRMYGVASSWDVFQRSGHGAEHTGPDAALMRRVVLGGSGGGSSGGSASLGEVFWLADAVPAGFDQYCNKTYREMDLQTATDAAEFRLRLISTVPSVDAGEPNERSMYALPAVPGRSDVDLVLLLRTGNTTAPVLWASRCTLLLDGITAATIVDDSANNLAAPGQRHRKANAAAKKGVCRPGTGIYNFAAPDFGAGLFSADQAAAAAAAAACDWSVPKPTNMPDSHTRTCASWLPDGRRWLVGSQLPQAGLRSPLTLSTSVDGISWSKVWSLRGDDTLPPRRYNGYPGFQYPAGMFINGKLYVSYSVNKEDIALTQVALDAI